MIDQPPPASTEPPDEQRRRAAQLARERRRAFGLSTALGFLYPLALWFSGLSSALWEWLVATGLSPWLGLVLWLVLYTLSFSLLMLPLSYHSGYELARRFDLSRQTPLAWLADWAKALGVGTVLSTLLGVIFFWLVIRFPENWWWMYALVLVAGMALMSYVAPYVLVPLFFRMRPLAESELTDRLRALLARAGVRVEQVCSLDFSRKTVEANAAVIGMGGSRKVVLADTLLESFTPEEIESVVAHELGHHVHRDVLRLLALEALLVVVALAAAHLVGLSLLAQLTPLDERALPAALPLLIVASQAYLLLVSPLSNAVSRRIEAAADRFALMLTQNGPAFAASMLKLADQNLAEHRPPRWAELLLYTHPPIADRVAFAQAWEPTRE